MTSVASPRGYRDVLNSEVFCWDELPDLLAAEELFEGLGVRCASGIPALPGAGPLVAKAEDEEEDDEDEEEDDDEEDDDLEDEEWEEVDDEEDDEEEEDEEGDDEEEDEEEEEEEEEKEDEEERVQIEQRRLVDVCS